MRGFIYLFFILGLITSIHAQYWFGPKFGLHRTDFTYDNTLYPTDSFSIEESFGWHAGAVFVYQATPIFSVQTEATYKYVNKEVTNRLVTPAFSRTEYNYLSIPFFLRTSLGKEPVHFFFGGGPEVNIWLGGQGRVGLDEFEEFGTGDEDGFIDYDFTFSEGQSDGLNIRAVPFANRVQYSLSAIAGVYLDLRTNGRLLVEGKYQWGHSNMGFNDNPDFTWEAYYENFEFHTDMISISISYLFHYDAEEANKGMSTISDSEKAAIKAKKKRK